jgi:LUD domain
MTSRKRTPLRGRFPHRVGLHDSCGTLRRLKHAKPSELNEPYFSKPMDLLSKVDGIEFVTRPAPRDLADVDFAMVHASFAVAETGSILLSDTHLRVNAVAYLAQHLIALLDPADIVINLHHAYHRPEFRDKHYASLHTGPSATADIESVLIHGAQGVRSLSVLPIAHATGNSPG